MPGSSLGAFMSIFSAETVVNQYERLYRDVVGSHRSMPEHGLRRSARTIGKGGHSKVRQAAEL